ncbi:MAG TPA: hypothetical protein VGD69_18235 [Herpetosiphonaceae bacterium]
MMPTKIARIAGTGLLATMLFSGCTAVAPAPPNVAATAPAGTAQAAKPAQSSAPAPSAAPAQTIDPADNVSPGAPLEVVAVNAKPYRTVAFKPTTGYSSVVVADNGRLYLSCGAQKNTEVVGVCMIDPATGSETFLVDPRKDNAMLGGVAGDGDWAVYGRMDEPQRIMAINTTTKETIEVGKITAGAIDSPVGLAFAISGSRIVWVDEAEDDSKKRVETVMLFDLNERKSRSLTTLKPSFVIDQIDISGDTIVWSQVDTSDVANVTSNVAAYDLATNQVRALSDNGRASMPQVYDHYVVWKTTATRFAYGSVYLYDLKTGSGKVIAKDDPQASPIPLGYDAPSIGSNGVTWISSSNEKIELYHPDTEQIEVLDQGGGRAFTEGHYLIWVNDSVKAKGDWHLLWSDLAAPAAGGSAPDKEATAPAPPPTALPATPEPSPASSAPAGGQKLPDTAWETYSGKQYQINYPAGSAISTDDLNSAVIFTLDQNQVIYSVRVTGPLPIPTGAKSPQDVLSAADQNLGSTSTAPQPLTLNGLGTDDYQAAGISTTGASEAPCGTFTTRTVELFAKGSEYRLHFEVFGSDHCDATQVALFDEVLQSFKLQ